MFIFIKNLVVLSKKGGVWTDQLISYSFWWLWSVQLFSFRHSFSKVLSDLREREFWIGRSRYERIESRPSLLLLHYYFSPSVYICRFLGSYWLIEITLYLLLYLLYFHPYCLVWFTYVQLSSDRQLERYWDLFSILGRRGLESREVTLLTYIFYLPTDS